MSAARSGTGNGSASAADQTAAQAPGAKSGADSGATKTATPADTKAKPVAAAAPSNTVSALWAKLPLPERLKRTALELLGAELAWSVVSHMVMWILGVRPVGPIARGIVAAAQRTKRLPGLVSFIQHLAMSPHRYRRWRQLITAIGLQIPELREWLREHVTDRVTSRL